MEATEPPCAAVLTKQTGIGFKSLYGYNSDSHSDDNSNDNAIDNSDDAIMIYKSQ